MTNTPTSRADEAFYAHAETIIKEARTVWDRDGRKGSIDAAISVALVENGWFPSRGVEFAILPPAPDDVPVTPIIDPGYNLGTAVMVSDELGGTVLARPVGQFGRMSDDALDRARLANERARLKTEPTDGGSR